jgi:hypothetical protein
MLIARTSIAVAACLLGTAWSQNTNRAAGIGVMTGTVRAADGSAVSGAKVELGELSFGWTSARLAAITSADGAYRIEVREGEYYVGVSRAGFVPTFYSKGPSPVDGPGDLLGISAGSTARLNFVMVPAGAITGKVINAFGVPAVRAEVSAVALRQHSSSGPFNHYLPPLPTDVDGSYRLAGLAPGEYRVLARPRDRAPAPLGTSDGPMRMERPTYHPATIVLEDAAIVTVGSGAEVSGIDITMRLHPVYRLKGQIIGLPEGASISMTIRSADVLLSPAVAASGTFDSFERLPAGRYQVTAQTSGRPSGANLWASADVVVTRDVDDFLLPLQGTSTLTGMVLGVKDVPRPGIRVLMVPLDSPFRERAVQAVPSGTTNAAGEFAVTDLFPGRYGIRAWASGELNLEVWLSNVQLAHEIVEIPPGQSVSGLAIRIK